MVSRWRAPFPWLMLAVGLAAGAGLRSIHTPAPSWVRGVADRLEDQARTIEKQQVLLEALMGSVNALRTGRPLDPGQKCLTGDELRAQLASARIGQKNETTPATTEAAASVSAVARAGENARDEVARLIDRSISTGGTWNDEQAAEFRSLLGLMTPTQRDESMSILVTALNDRRLQLAGHSPF